MHVHRVYSHYDGLCEKHGVFKVGAASEPLALALFPSCGVYAHLPSQLLSYLEPVVKERNRTSHALVDPWLVRHEFKKQVKVPVVGAVGTALMPAAASNA